MSWLTTANIRLGWAFDRWMVYVSGGYAGASINASADDPTLAPGQEVRASEWHNGWNIGVGVEWAVMDNIHIGLEYVHVELEDKVHPGFNNFGAPVAARNHLVDADIDIVRARLTFKLGHGHDAPAKPLK